MDQLPRSNDGYNSLFADSQPFHAYENSFLTGPDQAFNDASWGVNASNNYPNPARGQPALPQSWQQNANHLSTNAAQSNQIGQASPSAYGRSLSHSPAPFAQNPYGGFGNQQNFQYRQPSYDPALFNNAATTGQDFNTSYATYGNQAQTQGTIAPQALEHETRMPATANGATYDAASYPQNAFGQARIARAPAPVTGNTDQHAIVAAIPKGLDAGYHSIINFDEMVRATNSERMGQYINIGKQTLEWQVNRTTTLPQYLPRKTKNDLRKMAGNDTYLLAKIGKKAIKKERLLGTGPNGTNGFATVKGPAGEQIRYEGEVSSSEESSDEDDDSSYTSGEEAVEGSPLPNKRPDHPREAVEYDTIKALWRPKRKTVDNASLKKGIVDFWEVVKTIRDRWKTDAAAVAEAEAKKRLGELPLLKSRVKDGRDMIESAFKAALRHGHRSVVELLAQNASLVFLCYQFLLDRFKEEDLNGALTRVILELMTLFTTLDSDTLVKTHLDTVLQRYAKKGDAKTQGYAKRITASAAAASKEKVALPVPVSTAIAGKVASAASPTSRRPDPEPVAGVKRSASNAGAGGVQKKIATGAVKPNGVSATARLNGMVKKPGSIADTAKASTTATAPATKTKQVTAKPSAFFSSMQSAKKPGTSIKSGNPAQAAGVRLPERKAMPTTVANAASKSTFSFAETMANLAKPKEQKVVAKPEKELPPENAEQKAKRLKKEARRKLHVTFAMGEDLERIRYFTHDPDEELGHDRSQMRDVADAGGEGRALKLHHDMMDVEEEDEGEVAEQKLVEFKSPTAIDFKMVEEEERKRNYSKFGGGEMEPESAERAVREQYEATTLIVFYADEKDIPANPREPIDPYNGSQATESKRFGEPEPKFATRARQWKAAHPQPQPYYGQPQAWAPQSANKPAFDLSQYVNRGNGHQVQNTQPQTQQAPQMDIQAILAGLGLPPPQSQQHPQTPPMMNFGAPPGPPASGMMASQAMSQPNGHNPDLAAILAQLNPAQHAPQMGGFGGAQGAPSMIGFAPSMQQMQQSGAGGYPGDQRWRDQGEKQSHKPYKTQMCRFWREGNCTKGEGCTYLHEEPTS
ncbi:hypothetical protein LTR08_007394 [Meristemomyces frigidus]|nr:hypothetical protein LTR08_007394 [Meristemomyces frigidus]